MSSLDVADTYCWVLQILIFNVADVEFRCCRLVMLGLCRGGGGRGLLMFGCCTQHGSQHGRNIVATCGGGGRKTADVWMLHVTSFATCSEHVRNTLATSFVECCTNDGSQHGKSSSQHRKSFSQHSLCLAPDRRLIDSPHPNRAAQHPSDASARIGRPGASSSVLQSCSVFLVGGNRECQSSECDFQTGF
jgi:hypothetical protein